jgi:fibro-slime domain-containing protein
MDRIIKAINVVALAGTISAFGLGAAASPAKSINGWTSTGVTTVDTSSSSLPEKLQLRAVIRDFKGKNEKNGHPDFESYGNSAITTGLVQDTLDGEGKPVFKAKRGKQITTEFTDSAGRKILPSLCDTSKGDKPGKLDDVSSDQLTGAAQFDQWYRDTPGTNLSKVVVMELIRVSGTNRYVFDSASDEPYKAKGGFFPIDGDGWGNTPGWNKNFGFTTEIDTTFFFERSKGHVFTFTGDDDVWVFIDGKLVMDLGGLHPRREQTLELNRLSWLEDGKVHKLKVFHAERHTSESNFRIETTLNLVPADLPQGSALFD